MRASHSLHRVVPVQIVTEDCKQRELTKLFDSEAVLAVTVKRYSSDCEDLDVHNVGDGNDA